MLRRYFSLKSLETSEETMNQFRSNPEREYRLNLNLSFPMRDDYILLALLSWMLFGAIVLMDKVQNRLRGGARGVVNEPNGGIRC